MRSLLRVLASGVESKAMLDEVIDACRYSMHRAYWHHVHVLSTLRTQACQFQGGSSVVLQRDAEPPGGDCRLPPAPHA